MLNAVITYIFGEDKEILREPLVIDSNVEYICITDQKNLKSNTWKIIFDEISQAKCVRDKMVYVKYNPFKYTSANKICVIDGSLEIKESLLPLFNQCNNNDILIKSHTIRDNLYDELNMWIYSRNMSKNTIAKFENMSKSTNIDLHNKFLIESCVLVLNKTKTTQNLCDLVLEYMQVLGEDSLFLSNQCVLTYLIQQMQNIKYNFIDQYKYFNRYFHNTNWINKT